MAITAANFQAYVDANRLNTRLYYFVSFVDNNGNTYKYTDYPTQIFSHLPGFRIDVSTMFYQASLATGGYSVRPVSVSITNTEKPKAAASAYERFSDNFYYNEFESELCSIKLGFFGIASENDLVTLYNGFMSEFAYNVMQIDFKIIDRSNLELPSIPSNKFTRTAFPYISQSLIDKYIPLVYGRWDYETENATRYGDLSFVPAILIENRIDQSTPELVFKVTDSALDAITGLYLFDPDLNTVGAVQDTVANDLANGELTVTLNTGASIDFLQADYNVYADQAESVTGPVDDPESAVDGDFDTYSVIEDSEEMYVTFPIAAKLSISSLGSIGSATGGESSDGVRSVSLEVSGYGAATWTSESLLFTMENSSWSDSLSAANVNALSDVDSFNVTLATNLQIVNPRFWTSTTAFTIQEAADGAGTGAGSDVAIVPENGSYPTMKELAQECERKLQAATNAGTLTNSYRMVYVKNLNKMRIKVITAGAKPYFRIKESGASRDMGFGTGSSWISAWDNDEIDSNQLTILDIPDGDIGLIKVKIAITSGASSDTFRLKGVRLKVKRRFRDYSPRFKPVNVNDYVPFNAYSVPIANLPIQVQTRRGDVEAREAVNEQVAAGDFFVTCDGRPDASTSYWKTGAEIIKSILEDHLGIATADIDTTRFTAAATDTQISKLALYLAQSTPARRIIEDLARWSFGFAHVTAAGQYAINVVKSSYLPADTDHTIYYRDLSGTLSESVVITTNGIKNLAKDLDLQFMYNWAQRKYGRLINKTTTSTLNIVRKQQNCPYLTDETNADAMAEILSGDGSTIGYFGQLKAVVEVKLINAGFHLVELGDIVQFDTGWRNLIRIWGREPDSIYFMVLAKQFTKNEITLTLLEVGDTTPDLPESEAAEFDELFGEMF